MVQVTYFSEFVELIFECLNLNLTATKRHVMLITDWKRLIELLKMCKTSNRENFKCHVAEVLTFNAGIKSLRATLNDEIFNCGFCFLNRAFR
jgi:hypothetical protein